MFWIRMAWAQLWRRKMRTALLLFALSVAWAILLFFRGLAEEGYEQLADLLVQGRSGHVIIQSVGTDFLHPENFISDTQPILRVLPNSVRIQQRLFFSGLLQTDERKALFQSGTADAWPWSFYHAGLLDSRKEGFFWPAQDCVVLGAKLASQLQVAFGDAILLHAFGPLGVIHRKGVVCAVVASGDPRIDEQGVFVDIEQFRNWCGLPHAAHQIALYDAPSTATRLAHHVRALLNRSDIEIRTWREHLPMAAQFIDYHSVSVWIFQCIIFLIIAISLVDVFFVSMMERRRELGILQAVGMGRVQVLRMIVLEGILLGITAGVLGLILGSLLLAYGSFIGIDPSWFTGESGLEVAGGVFSGRIYARFPVATSLWGFWALLGLCLVSSFIPALLATLKKPVYSLRQR